jgi:hypothetical protein
LKWAQKPFCTARPEEADVRCYGSIAEKQSRERTSRFGKEVPIGTILRRSKKFTSDRLLPNLPAAHYATAGPVICRLAHP